MGCSIQSFTAELTSIKAHAKPISTMPTQKVLSKQDDFDPPDKMWSRVQNVQFSLYEFHTRTNLKIPSKKIHGVMCSGKNPWQIPQAPAQLSVSLFESWFACINFKFQGRTASQTHGAYEFRLGQEEWTTICVNLIVLQVFKWQRSQYHGRQAHIHETWHR